MNCDGLTPWRNNDIKQIYLSHYELWNSKVHFQFFTLSSQKHFQLATCLHQIILDLSHQPKCIPNRLQTLGVAHRSGGSTYPPVQHTPYSPTLIDSASNNCNVRRIVACLCLPVALALRFSLIVLIVVTRPRVIDGPRFLCNSAYLGECCFFPNDWNVQVCQCTNWGRRAGPLVFGRRVGLCSTRLI